MFTSEQRGYLDSLLSNCSFESPVAPVTCAVSGGADSLALLVLAVAHGSDVHAYHVDHGLRSGSSAEALVVADAAGRFGAEFTAIQIKVSPGPNLESRARTQRYEALPDGVATGHTADDQAETVLLAMLRGSAWVGLGGMEPTERRPLLGLRRSDTEELCQMLGLTPVDDPSNSDPVHRRNRVRHELLPLMASIAERDPVPILGRQAELLRQGGTVLAELAQALDPTDARGLAAAPEVLARGCVREWLWRGRGSEHPPDLATVDRVLDVARLVAGSTDVGYGWRVERSNMILRLVAPQDAL